MKNILQIIGVAMLIIGSTSCNNAQKMSNTTEAPQEKIEKVTSETVEFPTSVEKIEKTSQEWQAELDSEAFYVLRQAGTERAFTGEYWDNKSEGVYTCRACNLPLFLSDTKFKSGTGWPSFYQPINQEYVGENVDKAHGMIRTEVVCARCDGHLGHVFNDGPAPTGLRYCINSVSLDFVETENK